MQVLLHGIPNHVDVDVEITMCNPIAHSSHGAPRHLRVLLYEISVKVHQFGCSLTNDDEIHDNRLLSAFIGKEVVLAHAIDKAARIESRLPDVPNQVVDTIDGQTGAASETT